MSENYEMMQSDLLYLLGYIMGEKVNNEFTAFEGTEELSVRRALFLVNEKIKENK